MGLDKLLKGKLAMDRINVYQCDSCHSDIVTKQEVEGTTPMMIKCPHCDNGVAQSTWGKVIALTQPTHEWYKPSLRYAANRGPQIYEHVKLGGLLLRKIGEKTAAGVTATKQPISLAGGVAVDVDTYLTTALEVVGRLPRNDAQKERGVLMRVIEAFQCIGQLDKDEAREWYDKVTGVERG